MFEDDLRFWPKLFYFLAILYHDTVPLSNSPVAQVLLNALKVLRMVK